MQGGWGMPDPFAIYIFNPQLNSRMETTDVLALVGKSFEFWYNRNVAKDSPVSIVVNYSDMQTLTLKAYHRVCMELDAVSIKDGQSHVQPSVRLEENYNHGITSEDEAKQSMTGKLLVQLYSYKA